MTQVICGAHAEACRCGRSPGHPGEHVCADAVCGGAWTGDIDGDDFVPVKMPMAGGSIMEDAFLLASIFDD